MLTVDQQKPKKEVRFELAEEVEEASDRPEEEELLWWVSVAEIIHFKF